MSGFFRFWGDVFRGIGFALNMSPDVLPIVESYPNTGWIIFCIAVLCGASALLGQSVVLFLNHVRPGRFVISLILNGFILAISFISWGIAIWLLGSLLTPTPPTLGVTLRMVGLATAPFIFGFLGLVPYLGDVIARVLYVWSLLIMVRAVEFTFQLPYLQAVLVVGAGWLLLLLVSNTIGRPVVALRNLVWSRVVGTPQYASVQDLLTAYAADLGDDAKGGRR